MSKIVELLQELLGSVGNPLGEATYLSIGHLFLGSFLLVIIHMELSLLYMWLFPFLYYYTFLVPITIL